MMLRCSGMPRLDPNPPFDTDVMDVRFEDADPPLVATKHVGGR